MDRRFPLFVEAFFFGFNDFCDDFLPLLFYFWIYLFKKGLNTWKFSQFVSGFEEFAVFL